MNKKKEFIQLPPLPVDINGGAESILWEYAKMPPGEREHLQEYVEVIRQKIGRTEQGDITHFPGEEAEGLQKALKAMTGDLILEISPFSCMLYDLIYVKGQKSEILIEQHPESADLIRVVNEIFADLKRDVGQETDQ